MISSGDQDVLHRGEGKLCLPLEGVTSITILKSTY